MLDEGIAREVVNRVQRLRKKAKLQPSDNVTVQYTLEPANHDLGRIITQHLEYIETSTKNPMTTEAQDGEVLIVEKCELKGAQMTLTITKGASASTAVVKSVKMADYGLPKVGFVNVVSDGQCGVILMENPSTYVLHTIIQSFCFNNRILF